MKFYVDEKYYSVSVHLSKEAFDVPESLTEVYRLNNLLF